MENAFGSSLFLAPGARCFWRFSRNLGPRSGDIQIDVMASQETPFTLDGVLCGNGTGDWGQGTR